MTKRECAIVTAYTNECMLQEGDLKYLYEYIRELFGRPVARIKRDKYYELTDEIKALAEEDFKKLAEESTVRPLVRKYIPDGHGGLTEVTAKQTSE